jgi:poly(A) polymerase
MTSRNLRDKSNILERVPWIKSNDEYFQEEVNVGRSRLLLTKIAALLHDIAKPSTKKTDSAGKTRFLGHPEQGAEIAKSLMSRLKFSNREINFVSLIIEHHLRPMQLSNNLEKPSKKAIFRFKRDLKDALFSVLYLSIADYLAAKGPKLKDEQWDRRVEYCQWILSDLVDRKQNSHDEPPIITGHDLISSLELTPGPLIGLLLDEIKEAIAIGDITDKEAALKYAEKLIRKIESNEIGTDIRMEGIR